LPGRPARRVAKGVILYTNNRAFVFEERIRHERGSDDFWLLIFDCGLWIEDRGRYSFRGKNE